MDCDAQTPEDKCTYANVAAKANDSLSLRMTRLAPRVQPTAEVPYKTFTKANKTCPDITSTGHPQQPLCQTGNMLAATLPGLPQTQRRPCNRGAPPWYPRFICALPLAMYVPPDHTTKTFCRCHRINPAGDKLPDLYMNLRFTCSLPITPHTQNSKPSGAACTQIGRRCSPASLLPLVKPDATIM
jgi:hypothetical protein